MKPLDIDTLLEVKKYFSIMRMVGSSLEYMNCSYHCDPNDVNHECIASDYDPFYTINKEVFDDLVKKAQSILHFKY